MKLTKNVEEYIAAQVPEMRPKLEIIRNTIQKLVPEAQEVISYGMPAFKYHGMLAYYAAFKNHYSLFFGAAVTKEFLPQLDRYETSKGTIKIPNDRPVPVTLLRKLTKFAAKRNLEKARLKELIKKKKSKKIIRSK